MNSRIEHIYGGVPDDSQLYERRAYVLAYNDEQLVPRWAAWHATAEYRRTPKRESRWKVFWSDPELPQVQHRDYLGWFDSEYNLTLGRIVPYFIAGGDRDGDGKGAGMATSLPIEDGYDACTLFEVNALSNIAPQYHGRFNGYPGLWWQLESLVRTLVDDGNEYHLFAGTVFLEDVAVQKVGDLESDPSAWSIGVPHGFFKLVIDVQRNEAVGFLFDHGADLADGCDIDVATLPYQCVATIEQIESATGLDFFRELRSGEQQLLSESSNASTWFDWIRRLD
jgi:endonuclease G